MLGLSTLFQNFPKSSLNSSWNSSYLGLAVSVSFQHIVVQFPFLSFLFFFLLKKCETPAFYPFTVSSTQLGLVIEILFSTEEWLRNKQVHQSLVSNATMLSWLSVQDCMPCWLDLNLLYSYLISFFFLPPLQRDSLGF